MAIFGRDKGTQAAPARKGVARSVYKQTLTAAAQLIGGQPAQPGQQHKAEPWQNDAWTYRDAVGELHYAGWFIGGCLSRVRLRAGWVNDDQTITELYDGVDENDEPVPIPEVDAATADLATRLVRLLKSDMGGQARLLFALGENLSIPGDCYLLGIDRVGPLLDGSVGIVDRSFEVLSIDELRSMDGGKTWTRHRTPGGTGEPLPPGTRPIRIWWPHPRYSGLADSAVRALIDVLEEIVLLTRGVRAGAVSRLLAAGVYWIPSEIDFPSDGDTPEGSEEDDQFTRDLIATASTAIADKGSAASAVPFVARAPSQYIPSIRHDTFQPPDDNLSILKRTEAVRRFAQGMPLPVETIIGMQQANHWSAWQIDEDTFKVHIEPVLEVIADGLTQQYLLVALCMAMRIDPAGNVPEMLRRIVVWWDETELVVHPDRGPASVLLYDRMEVSGDALRREHGFGEGDKPDEDEVAEFIRRKQYASPAALAAMARAEQAGTTLEDATPAEVDDTGTPDAPAPEQGAPAVEPGPPPAGPPDPAVTAAAYPTLLLQLMSGGELAVARAVTRAGSRLRDKATKRPELAATVRGVEASDVARRLGRETVAHLSSLPDLFTGEFAALERQFTEWARQAQHPNADVVAAAALAVVERVTRERLFNPSAQIPLEEIEQAISGAGS